MNRSDLMVMEPDLRAAIRSKAYQEAGLMKACVRSVVYHLKTNLAKLEYETDIAEQEQGCCGHTEEVKNRIKRAEANLWHSVQRMKWLEGDGEKVAWIKVKEGKGPPPELQMGSNR